MPVSVKVTPLSASQADADGLMENNKLSGARSAKILRECSSAEGGHAGSTQQFKFAQVGYARGSTAWG